MGKRNLDIDILRFAFVFAIEAMDFCDKLEELNKKPIAKRILKSTLSAICYIQQSMEAERSSIIKKSIKEAKRNLKNAMYWLEQCHNSGYLYSESLFEHANRIQEYLNMESEVV